MNNRLSLGIKRLFDFSVAAFFLTLALPILAVLSAAVRITSSGPAYFRQERLGQDGKKFSIVKFRTMFNGSEHTEVNRDCYSYASDPRVTPLGRLLRNTSLDELPQLINVLRGEMSLVGPRPALPHHLNRYSEEERQRLRFRPGITGLAQVSGRNSLSWEERIQCDLDYIRNWSLMLDFKILIRTVGVVLRREGVALEYRWRKHECQ